MPKIRGSLESWRKGSELMRALMGLPLVPPSPPSQPPNKKLNQKPKKKPCCVFRVEIYEDDGSTRPGPSTTSGGSTSQDEIVIESNPAEKNPLSNQVPESNKDGKGSDDKKAMSIEKHASPKQTATHHVQDIKPEEGHGKNGEGPKSDAVVTAKAHQTKKEVVANNKATKQKPDTNEGSPDQKVATGKKGSSSEGSAQPKSTPAKSSSANCAPAKDISAKSTSAKSTLTKSSSTKTTSSSTLTKGVSAGGQKSAKSLETILESEAESSDSNDAVLGERFGRSIERIELPKYRDPAWSVCEDQMICFLKYKGHSSQEIADKLSGGATIEFLGEVYQRDLLHQAEESPIRAKESSAKPDDKKFINSKSIQSWIDSVPSEKQTGKSPEKQSAKQSSKHSTSSSWGTTTASTTESTRSTASSKEIRMDAIRALSRMYPDQKVFRPDAMFDMQDCQALAVAEARYRGFELSIIQAQFTDLTGREVDKEVLQAKLTQGVHPKDSTTEKRGPRRH
ncbi:hypothetical protein F5Y11DRAFT_349866 [Daldinia sp. FL1419]|nr:hypothetical protein F5Y11DRAFT_349866 [Daldinia sp. FL1419]